MMMSINLDTSVGQSAQSALDVRHHDAHLAHCWVDACILRLAPLRAQTRAGRDPAPPRKVETNLRNRLRPACSNDYFSSGRDRSRAGPSPTDSAGTTSASSPTWISLSAQKKSLMGAPPTHIPARHLPEGGQRCLPLTPWSSCDHSMRWTSSSQEGLLQRSLRLALARTWMCTGEPSKPNSSRSLRSTKRT